MCLTLFLAGFRRRHADVIEFVWLLNSHPEVTFTWMHGDKDTYRLAFHLANKGSQFAQVNTCCVTSVQLLLAMSACQLWYLSRAPHQSALARACSCFLMCYPCCICVTGCSNVVVLTVAITARVTGWCSSVGFISLPEALAQSWPPDKVILMPMLCCTRGDVGVQVPTAPAQALDAHPGNVSASPH